MRRIAAVALAAGTLIAGVAATAAPAQAATKTGKWVTKDGWTVIKADGKYSKTASKVTVSGYLTDTKKDGWVAGVQFRMTEGKTVRTTAVYYLNYNGSPADMAYRHYYGKFTSSTLTTHLYVREVALKKSHISTTKAGPWKKVY